MKQGDQGWGDEPSVLIFSDQHASSAAARSAAESVGARVIGMEPINAALDRLHRQAAVDSVLIELERTGSVAVDRLLDWANHAGRSGSTRPIITIPHAVMDDVIARIDAPEVMVLVDPSPEERVSSLGLALAERRQRLHDTGYEADAERLRRLSDEVARIAGALAELSSSAKSAAFTLAKDKPAAPTDAPIDGNMVRNLIRVRRLRDQFFSKELFADPAWDMLLDLMASHLEQSRVAVSSLCIAAAVPPTTALRWIRTLTEQGLFVRREDPEDGRRIFIELSEPASDALIAYLQTAYQMGFRTPQAA